MEQPCSKWGSRVWCVVLAAGVLLSPLTPWNDAFINAPLAFVLALPIGLIEPRWMIASLVAAYIFTNFLGLALILIALPRVGSRWGPRRLRGIERRAVRRSLVSWVAIAVVALLVTAILQERGMLGDPMGILDAHPLPPAN